MIKFAALNATTDTHNTQDGTPTTSKEVIESDAISKYRSALLLIKNKSHTKAEEALKELLLHPYFSFDDESFSAADFFNDPAVKLLTAIYKNLGKVHETVGNYDDALDCYMEAVSSDKSDITTWYNIANVAIHKVNYEVACNALKDCLNLNASFWPCIDTLICVLYALGDYLSCLHLIQHALSLNKEFDRALCVKEQIKKEDPFLFKSFSWKEDFMDLQPDSSKSVQELKYPFALKERDRQAKKSAEVNKTTPTLKLRKISMKNSLADLGNAIIELYSQVKKENISLFSPVDFSTSNIDELLKSFSPTEELTTSDATANDERNNEIGGMVIAGPSDAELSQPQEKTAVWSDDRKVEDKEATDKEKQAKEAKELKELKEMVRREGSRRSRRVQEKQEEPSETAPITTLLQELERCIPTSLLGLEAELTENDSGQNTLNPEPNTSTKIDGLDASSLISEILSDREISLIPLMKMFCNKLSAQYSKLWSREVTKAFLKVYLSYREYEALPNILQNFQSDSTESNVLTLMYAFEIIVDNDLFPEAACNEPFFKDICLSITKASLVNDQEFLRTASTHEGIKQMFSSELLYKSFQVRYAWAYCLYEQKLSNTECAVEFIKLCLSTLQESQLDSVVTANMKHQFISSEVLEHQKKILSDILSRDNVTALFKDKDYVKVVDILLPILNENQPNLDINDESRLPTRHKNLLILLESLKKLDKFQNCLKCCELLLTELVPFVRFTDTWKSLFQKIFKALVSCLQNMKSPHSDHFKLSKILKDIIKLIVSYYDALSVAESNEESIFLNLNFNDFPIERAWITYHMIIEKCLDSPDISADSDNDCHQHKLDPLLLAHEWLGKYSHCTNTNGIFLIHTLESCLYYKHEEDQFSEDLTNLFEQAIFCLIGHPGAGSKRSKKNRVSHSTTPLPLKIDFSYLAYSYYAPDAVFDPGEKNKHISADTFDLFQKIALSLDNITSTETFLKIKLYLEKGSISSYKAITMSESQSKFKDVYYLCGDYLMKYEDFSQAIDWYVCDLCIHPTRMISWLALGKCWLTIAEDRFNHAESDLKYVIESMAPKALLCFDYFLAKEPPTFAILSEYACFVFTIASAYNQILRSIDDEENAASVQEEMIAKRTSLISKAKEQYNTRPDPEKEDGWVKSYMMGKIEEKLNPKELKWLDYYMKAFENLEDYVVTLLKKINYNSPIDYSMECLELCFRVAYSVYKGAIKYPEIADNEKIEISLKQVIQLMGINTEGYELPKVYGEQPHLKLVLQILEECLAKFPEHYKMRNALVSIYLKTNDSAEWSKAKSIMFQDQNNSGLFSLSKKHLFYGIWRIPVDAVDRPGSFFRHMQKSLLLLIQTLTKCQDIENLIKLFEFMVRTVDQLNVYVVDVAQFLQHCVTTVDVLLTKHVSEYYNIPETVNQQKSIQFLKLAQKAKNAHIKASLPTKPIDAVSMLILKHLKLSVPQQMTLIDPKCLVSPWRLHDVVNQVLNEHTQNERNARVLEAARQRISSMEQQNNAVKDAQRIQIPLSGTETSVKIPEVSSSTSSQKILVNDNAKTAIGQAIASFISQMTESQHGRTDSKNVSQFLHKFINSSIQSKTDFSNVTHLKLADAVNKATSRAMENSAGSSAQKLTPTKTHTVKSPVIKSPSLIKSSINVIKTSAENKVKEQDCAIMSLSMCTSSRSSGSVKKVTPMSLKKAIPRLHKTISVLAKNNKLIQKVDLSQCQNLGNSAVCVRLKDKSANVERLIKSENLLQHPITPKEANVIKAHSEKEADTVSKAPEANEIKEFERPRSLSLCESVKATEVNPRRQSTMPQAVTPLTEDRPQELQEKVSSAPQITSQDNIENINLTPVSLDRIPERVLKEPLLKQPDRLPETKSVIPEPISLPKPRELIMPSPIDVMPSPVNVMPSLAHLLTQSKPRTTVPMLVVSSLHPAPVPLSDTPTVLPVPVPPSQIPSSLATPITVTSSAKTFPSPTTHAKSADDQMQEREKAIREAQANMNNKASSFLDYAVSASVSNVTIPRSMSQTATDPRLVNQTDPQSIKHNLSRSMSLNDQPNSENSNSTSPHCPPLMRSNSTNESMMRQHSLNNQEGHVRHSSANCQDGSQDKKFERQSSSGSVTSVLPNVGVTLFKGSNVGDISPKGYNRDPRIRASAPNSNLTKSPDEKPKLQIKREVTNDSESDEDDMPSLESGVSAIETKSSNPGIKSGTQKALETHLNNRKLPSLDMPKMPSLNYADAHKNNPADGNNLPQPPLLIKKEEHGYPQPPQLSSPMLQSPPPMHNFKQYPQFGEGDKTQPMVSSSPSSITPTTTACLSGNMPGNMKLDLSKQFILAPIEGQCSKDKNMLDSPGMMHGMNNPNMMGGPNNDKSLPNSPHFNQSYILPKSQAKSPAILTLHPVSQGGTSASSYFSNIPGVQGPHNIKKIKQPKAPKEKLTKEEKARRKREKELAKLEKKNNKRRKVATPDSATNLAQFDFPTLDGNHPQPKPPFNMSPITMVPDSIARIHASDSRQLTTIPNHMSPMTPPMMPNAMTSPYSNAAPGKSSPLGTDNYQRPGLVHGTSNQSDTFGVYNHPGNKQPVQFPGQPESARSPYQVNNNPGGERVYQADDFFAGAKASPQPQTPDNMMKSMNYNPMSGLKHDAQKPITHCQPEISQKSGMIGMNEMTYSNPMMGSQQIKSEKEDGIMEPNLDNIDLGILDELDGIDLTEEKLQTPPQPAAPVKAKRGRKPKDPSQKAAPKRKKAKASAKTTPEVPNYPCHLPQTSPGFNLPNQPQFPYPGLNPSMGYPPQQATAEKSYFYPPNTPTGGATPRPWSGAPNQANSTTSYFPMQGSLQPHTVQHPTQLGITPAQLPPTSPLTSPVGGQFQAFSPNHSFNSTISGNTTPSPVPSLYQPGSSHFSASTTQSSYNMTPTKTTPSPLKTMYKAGTPTNYAPANYNISSEQGSTPYHPTSYTTSSVMQSPSASLTTQDPLARSDSVPGIPSVSSAEPTAAPNAISPAKLSPTSAGGLTCKRPDQFTMPPAQGFNDAFHNRAQPPKNPQQYGDMSPQFSSHNPQQQFPTSLYPDHRSTFISQPPTSTPSGTQPPLGPSTQPPLGQFQTFPGGQDESRQYINQTMNQHYNQTWPKYGNF